MKTFPDPWWRLNQWIPWRLGHKSEEGFWDRYLCSQGLRWQEEFSGRMNPDLGLDAAVLATALCTALAAVSHALIEKHIVAFGHRWKYQLPA